ncbi:MAG: CDP-alcohol phosphatidyltransferase family protein [Planctomycetes bacterium]|nr:CDP-alcohol phosphatidyltransferase family protein [Planctomycetota bacterium]
MPTQRPDRFETGNGDEPRSPLLSISLVPSAATLGNLLCGFVAILCCLLEMRAAYFEASPQTNHPRLAELFPTWVSVGVYLIVAAMVFDALDGRLARMARRTSEFGAQLDSISDIVSFGIAPAALYLTILMTRVMPAEGEPLVSRMLWRLGLLCALVYVSCAAIRLARYNAENVKEEAAQRQFTGLPTPGAAAALVALLALHDELAAMQVAALGIDWSHVLRWAIGPVAFGLGMLMVGRLNFLHVFNVYFRRKYPPTYLVWGLVLVGFGLWWPQMLLVTLAYLYVIGGLVQNLIWRRWRTVVTPVTKPPSSVDVN